MFTTHRPQLLELARHPERLDILAPALRSLIQSLAISHAFRTRTRDFFRAEGLRRDLQIAGELLQAAEDRA